MQNEKNEKLGFAGRIAEIFVTNGRLSILLIITFFVWGALSFYLSPKQYNPEIVAPAFNIITEFRGAGSREVLELVTKPIENKVNDIPGVDEVVSRSIDGGLSVVTVKFFVGEDMEKSKIKIMQRITGNMDKKPVGAGEPIIQELNLDDVPVLTIALSSDQLSQVTMRKLAFDIMDDIKNINNVSNIEVSGGKQRQIKIKLDPERINAQNISIMRIIDIFNRNNIKLPSGEIETDTEKIFVNIDANIYGEDDIKNMVLQTSGDHVVYLSDVADIVTEEEDVKDYVKFKKDPDDRYNTVYLSVAKKKGSQIGRVTGDVLDKIDELKKSSIPASVNIDVVRDEGRTANEEIRGLVINLGQAILIVFLVLLAFLGKRPAFIVAVAIPLVLASVFGAGLLAGQSINRITLFALILSLGLLVDNATVVVENAVRHASQGGNLKKAVIRSVDEVGMGLFMSTVTTLLAFFPMAFISGMMGPYMGPIPFFVPAALIFSLLIAFTINPYLSSILIKKEDNNNKKEGGRMAGVKEGIEKVYQNFLGKVFRSEKLQKKILLYSFLAFLFVMILPLTGIVKFRMLPKADREQFYVYLDYPENILLEDNERISSGVEDLLLKNEEVLSVQSFIGVAPVIDFNGLFKGAQGRGQSNNATIKVNLTHHKDRDIKSEDIVLSLRLEINELLRSYPDVKFKLIEDPPGPPVLSTVLLKIQGGDYEKLKEISRDVEKMLEDTAEVVDIDSSRDTGSKDVVLRIDYDKAQRSGIDAHTAAYVLRTALSGNKVAVIHDENNREQEFVVMRFEKQHRNSIDDLDLIYLSNNKGEKVPLLEIVEKTNGKLPDTIYQDNREKTVYVTAEMGDRSVTYATLDMYLKLIKYKLTDGTGKLTGVSFFGFDFLDQQTGEKFKIEWGGEWKLTVEVFRDLGLAMMVAVFLIYVALVAQFHSFKAPFLIMMTIPLAMIGVLPGFAVLGAVKGLYFNATSMIGVIALAGIVVNNAIILIEYLNSFRGQNISLSEALINAGTTRMRPIILTSLTTILGSLAIIGDPVWAGLAWSIVFGISISTLLTLIIFPILYFVFEKKEWD